MSASGNRGNPNNSDNPSSGLFHRDNSCNCLRRCSRESRSRSCCWRKKKKEPWLWWWLFVCRYRYDWLQKTGKNEWEANDQPVSHKGNNNESLFCDDENLYALSISVSDTPSVYDIDWIRTLAKRILCQLYISWIKCLDKTNVVPVFGYEKIIGMNIAIMKGERTEHDCSSNKDTVLK